jgi:hypothetical protein
MNEDDLDAFLRDQLTILNDKLLKSINNDPELLKEF